MKKLLTGILLTGTCVLVLPLYTQALMAQPPADDYGTGTVTKFCPKLTTTLTKGMRDTQTSGQVTELQVFLADQFDLSDSFPTGFFGTQTQKYVVKLQQQYGLPAFGIVGSMTRSKISEICNGSSIVGGDRDIHGCIGSAGYTWCATSNKCIRTWEEKCSTVIDTNPASDPLCKIWFDGCNTCSRATQGGEGMCTMMACIQGYPVGQQPKPYCKEYFTATTNRPPVISGFSGPTKLAVHEYGVWRVDAKDPEGGQLSYTIRWGDEYTNTTSSSAAPVEQLVQTTTFSHVYTTAGMYTVAITVRDSAGQVAQMTTTVSVSGVSGACTKEYAPVCGVRPPSCIPGAQCDASPKTYSNICVMKSEGGILLYEGVCNAPTPTPVACTMEYAPVCGIPKYCQTTAATAYIPPTGYPKECTSGKTYGNKCSLTAEGAIYKYSGECNQTSAI